MNKKKLAVVGTSPIMLLLYFRLDSFYDITVYDYKANIGGAWSIEKTKNITYSSHNNIIIPDNKTEDDAILEINDELKNYGCKILLPDDYNIPKYNYIANNIYLHDFTEFFNFFKSKKPNLINKKIANIDMNKNKILVDENHYDLVFLPSCFHLENLVVNNKKIEYNYNTVISSHFSAIIEKNNLDTCTYTDNFDDIFDRAQVKNYKNYKVFTGRVRKKFKNREVNFLMENSLFLKSNLKYFSYYKLQSYEHNVIENNSLKFLRNLFKNTNLSIIETRQLNHSYLEIDKITKKFQKYI